jgi:superfamily II DNA or RNA helicase
MQSIARVAAVNDESLDLAACFSKLSVLDSQTSTPTSTPALPLRDYQADIVKQIEEHWTRAPSGSRCSLLLYLPTGGGKTRIAAHLISSALRPPDRCLFLVNRTKLVEQAAETFSSYGLRCGFLKAGLLSDPEARVQVASIQTVARRSIVAAATTDADVPGASQLYSLVIIDEAHAAVAQTYQQTLAALVPAPAPAPAPPAAGHEHEHVHGHVHGYGDVTRRPQQLVLGLTATPLRLSDKDRLSAVFHRILLGPPLPDLVRRGVLVPSRVVSVGHGCTQLQVALAARAFGPVAVTATKQPKPGLSASSVACAAEATPDSGASSRASKVSVVMSEQPFLSELISAWHRHADGRLTAAFCVDIAHSRATAAAFAAAGIASAHLDGDTPKAEREHLFDSFRHRKISVLCSVNVLSEGFDEPAVECVMLLRPTESVGLYLQQIGRGLRACDGKRDCVVLDAAANAMRHGLVTDPRAFNAEWGEDHTIRLQRRASASGVSDALPAVPSPSPSALDLAWVCRDAGCGGVTSGDKLRCCVCGLVRRAHDTYSATYAATAESSRASRGTIQRPPLICKGVNAALPGLDTGGSASKAGPGVASSARRPSLPVQVLPSTSEFAPELDATVERFSRLGLETALAPESATTTVARPTSTLGLLGPGFSIPRKQKQTNGVQQ